MLREFHFVYKLSGSRLYEGKAASSVISSKVENIYLPTTEPTVEVNAFIN